MRRMGWFIRGCWKGKSRERPQLNREDMECNRQHTSEPHEVVIRGEDRKVITRRDRANQEIRIRALNPSRAASIEERSRLLVVIDHNGGVNERSQIVTQPVKLWTLFESRQNFLPDRTDDRHSAVLNQFGQFRTYGFVLQARFTTPQRKRPDWCVYQHLIACCAASCSHTSGRNLQSRTARGSSPASDAECTPPAPWQPWPSWFGALRCAELPPEGDRQSQDSSAHGDSTHADV